MEIRSFFVPKERERSIMKHITSRQIALNGLIAGLYAVVTILTASFAYGNIQFRLAEALCLLVALEPTRDLEINRQAAGMLPFRSFVLPAPRDEQLTIGMMQKMRVIVSMRLHALIFASSVGAPLAAISYDPKVTGFMAYLGQKHCMELADVTKDSLCALIDDAMQTAQPYSTDRLRRLAAENEEAARVLLEESL